MIIKFVSSSREKNLSRQLIAGVLFSTIIYSPFIIQIRTLPTYHYAPHYQRHLINLHLHSALHSNNPTMTTNIDLDKYIRNFRIFYSKIVNGHPQQANLQKKFKFLIQNETTKWRTGLFANKIQDNATSLKTFMSKTKSAVPKPAVKKEKHDWLLETQNFSRCFVYRSILALLELKSKEGIQMIRAHLENDGALAEGKMFSGFAFRKVSYAWSKIEKLFLSTFQSKPHATLSEAMNEFPQEFIEVLYDVFVDRRVPKLALNEINQENLDKLSDLIKTNINFFEFENEKPINIRKGGNYKKNVYIGYLMEQKIFVVAKQMPKNQAQDQNQRKTLGKLAVMSSDLFKMYENDQIKLRNLDSIAGTRPKGSRQPGTQSGMHNSPMTASQSKVMMNSTLNTPPRGNSRGMMNSTLHAPPKVSGSSSKLMANSTYGGGLSKKSSLRESVSTYKGSRIMSSTRY